MGHDGGVQITEEFPDHVLLTPATTATPQPGYRDAAGGRTPEQLARTAVSAATSAARHVRSTRGTVAGEDGRVPVASTKSSQVDPVTAVDRSSEALIRGLLEQSAPGDAVLGEEGGGRAGGGGVTWVVDPVDGTVNFIYGLPAVAVSVAAVVDGEPVAAAVADVFRARVYSAWTGGPAVVAGERSAAASSLPGPDLGLADMSRALVATGFSYRSERRTRQAELLCRLLPGIRDIRRAGSAALDLCAVASGGVDAYYEHGLGPWDHAAGALIAARSGAWVCMPRLTAGYAEGVGVLAASPGVFSELAGHVLDTAMPYTG